MHKIILVIFSGSKKNELLVKAKRQIQFLRETFGPDILLSYHAERNHIYLILRAITHPRSEFENSSKE